MTTALTIIGTRPQFVKAAMVSRAVTDMNDQDETCRIREILVHTGQHYDKELSDVFFRDLDLPSPAHQLGIGSGSHGQQTGRMLEALERVMDEVQPDCVIVYGDTNSTLAGALAASKLHIPVAHVEAGLRSFNRTMPEEINRVLVDHMARWLFCPTQQAVKNLNSEGVGAAVHLVGDVMAEALQISMPIAERESRILERLSLDADEYILATVHRAENTDNQECLTGIVRAFTSLGKPVVFPCHPRTRKMMIRFGVDRLVDPEKVRLVEPVGYLDMLRLESQAAVIVTDSGGVQKEAFWLGVPCVTLRDETEWVETLDTGRNRLAGAITERILPAVRSALAMERSKDAMPQASTNAARAIVEILLDSLRDKT